MGNRTPLALFAVVALILAITAVQASSGDRNPTFQHCLKGCQVTYCDPSQPPIPFYLRAFGWSCLDNCKYSCAHSFTDNIRGGGRWHQFYGKWPFYRFGPIQEPLSVLMSLGNLWVNLRGMEEVRRRVRKENKLHKWLIGMGWVQVNTWVWSTVFHTRDTPFTEFLDYLSATLTICFTLLYTLLRIPSLISPTSTSKYVIPLTAIITFLFISHWTYLLSFPSGSFPYGYHIQFNLLLASIHNILWITWSLSFYIGLPKLSIPGRSTPLVFPSPYPPQDPIRHRTKDSSTPAILVGLTILAMSLELLDFSPFLRVLDAHALWHAATIPLTLAWWTFLATDAVDMETALYSRGSGTSSIEKMPLSGGGGAGGNNPGLGLGMATVKSVGGNTSGGGGGGDDKIGNGNIGVERGIQNKSFVGIASGGSHTAPNTPSMGMTNSPVLGSRSKSPNPEKGRLD